jgi:hypothetical protein
MKRITVYWLIIYSCLFLIGNRANAINCQITSPSNGQTVQRLVPIHITASDPDGIKVVWIKVEGSTTSRAIEPNSTSYGYLQAYSHISAGDFQWDWDTQKYPNGVYLLTACAYDSATEYRYNSVSSITVRNTLSTESGFRNYVTQVWNNFVINWDPYNYHYGSNKYAALVGKYTAFAALYYAYTTSSSARMKTERGITYAKDSLLAYYTFNKNGTTYHACYTADTSYGSVTVDGDTPTECYHSFWISLAFAYAKEALGTNTTFATTTSVAGLANHIEHIYCDVLGNLKRGGYSGNGMGNAVAALAETAIALNTTKYDNSIRYIYDALIWFQDWDTTGEAKGAFVDGGGYIAEYPPLPPGTTYRCYNTMSYEGWCANGLMHMRKKFGGTYGAPTTLSLDTRIWNFLEFCRAAQLVGKEDTAVGSYAYPQTCGEENQKLVFKKRPFNADNDGCWNDPDPEQHYEYEDMFGACYAWVNAEQDFQNAVNHAGSFYTLGARSWQLEAGMAALDHLIHGEPPVVPIILSDFIAEGD